MRDMRVLDVAELAGVVDEQPQPVLFATVSGAHLYGFASVDSDVDLRGVHLLPADLVVGLTQGPSTLTSSFVRAGAEIDLVTHDLAKFAGLLLRRNGYVMEQLLSPLVITSSPAHAQLVALAPACLTRHHAHHYLGFARSQWSLFLSSRQLKPLLYTFRTLLTGSHLMRTGEVVAHLPTLLDLSTSAPGWLRAAVELKTVAEHAPVDDRLPDLAQLERAMSALVAALESDHRSSSLPEAPTAQPGLHDLLVGLRLGRPL